MVVTPLNDNSDTCHKGVLLSLTTIQRVYTVGDRGKRATEVAKKDC